MYCTSGAGPTFLSIASNMATSQGVTPARDMISLLKPPRQLGPTISRRFRERKWLTNPHTKTHWPTKKNGSPRLIQDPLLAIRSMSEETRPYSVLTGAAQYRETNPRGLSHAPLLLAVLVQPSPTIGRLSAFRTLAWSSKCRLKSLATVSHSGVISCNIFIQSFGLISKVMI
jgi:hypothetical protein